MCTIRSSALINRLRQKKSRKNKRTITTSQVVEWMVKNMKCMFIYPNGLEGLEFIEIRTFYNFILNAKIFSYL